MELTGILRKLEGKNPERITYSINLDGEPLILNDYIGQPFRLSYHSEIFCIRCNRKTSKSFGEGFCYPCFTTAPEASDCVLRPELCQAHLGISRDMDWSENHCLQDHFVYLALTSTVKVGVTRSSQIPSRWIDQGAWKAIKLAKTPNRYQAGVIEVELKKHLTDKTNWRHMLTDQRNETVDLEQMKEFAIRKLPHELQSYTEPDNHITLLQYPVHQYPNKVNSLNLDKINGFQGQLNGIRGQYLILENGMVFNVRSHSGYKVSISLKE